VQVDDKQGQVVAQGGLSARFIAMSGDEAAGLARDAYGITAQAERLATEKDDTFRLETADSRRYILKIANPCETAEELDFQIEVLKHVARRAPQLPIPRVIASLNGEEQFCHRDHAGQLRRVRLLSYLDGRPLSEFESTPEEREHMGEMLGRLRLALADFAHPADRRVLAWDVKHLLGLGDLMEAIDDPKKRRLLEAGMDRFAALQPQLATCRAQVVHNDFSKSNIVVDRAAPGFVTGIIDFGDAVRTLIAIDVSTALVNQLPSRMTDDIFAEGRDLLRGYLRVADLSMTELRLIPHLVMARAVARALLSVWRAKRFPENAAYLLRNTEQGWAQLSWFMQRPVDEISETLLEFAASDRGPVDMGDQRND